MPRTAMAVTLPRNPAGYCGGVGSWFPTGLWHPTMSKRMRPLSRRTRSFCKEPKGRAAKRHLAKRKRLINHGYPWVSNESNGWFLWFMIIFHHFSSFCSLLEWSCCGGDHVTTTSGNRPKATRWAKRWRERLQRGDLERFSWSWSSRLGMVYIARQNCQILPDIASSSLPGTELHELPDIARLGRMTKTKIV